MSITPHIVVQNAKRAAAFYSDAYGDSDAYGAEEVRGIPTPDGRLMSVQLRIGDGLLHISDEFPELGVLAPPSIGGTPVVLALHVVDADAVFAQAVDAGAEVRQPLQDMFWGTGRANSLTRSGTAGTSLSTSATYRTTRSSPPPRRLSAARRA